MERSRKIFLEISSASQEVIIAANKYADRKGLPGVQRSHFQLEADMRRISVACDTLASILGRLSLLDDPAFDVRLQDWLSSDEPRVCLDTLSRMEKFFRKDTSSWKNICTKRRGTTTMQSDKIKEAVDLFGSCKGCFHFLFTTETLNNEGGIRQQQDVPKTPSRPHIQMVESNIFDQNLPVAGLTSSDTTVPDAAVHQREHAVTRRTYQIVDIQRKKEEDAHKLEEVFGWLDGLNCAEKQDVTLLLRQPDTCKWLFDTFQYKMWRDGESSCLWLYGKPGAGKSVLASSVIDSLEKIQREGGILAFFYCDFRNERSTSASEALRSILFQLLRQLQESAVEPGNLIDDLVDAKKRGGATRNNIKELAGFASRTARLFVTKPLVVVDALDECKDVETLLEGLNAVKEYIQLFITSRPLAVIKDGLSGVPFVSMDNIAEELSADIALHVTRELDARRRLRILGAEIKTEIRSVLCHKADGMFHWVQCSIDTLSRCVTLKEVQVALDNLPEGLDETYERILRSIDIETREGQLALRTLVWLVAALRPLHINELMEGLSIDVEKRILDLNTGPMHRVALLDACGSLVTYTEKTHIINLSHFSVKEYLMSEFARTKLPQYHIDWECAHLQLVRSCMCYISIWLGRLPESDGSSSTSADVSSNNILSDRRNPIHPTIMPHPLLDYVLKDTLVHFQYVGSQIEAVLSDVKVLAEDIQRHSRVWDDVCLAASWTTYSTTPNWPVSSHDLALYILIAFAPDSLLHTYLPRSAFEPKRGTNPLVYTAYFNKHEQARTLLSRGVKLNSRGWDIDGSLQVLPIEVALRNGHYSMATFFVAEGSTVSSQIFTDLFSHSYASVPSTVKRRLLQTDDFAETVNDASNSNRPRLQLLDSCKHFLIDAGLRGKDLIALVRRMIQVAPDRGHISVMRFFDSFLCTSVEYFPEDDTLEIVQLLVNYGCDPLQANCSRKTPVYLAVERAHISVAQYLVSLGAQLPPDLLVTVLEFWHSDLEWNSPVGSKVPMVYFLIENGVDVHMRTKAGDSALHITLESFHENEALEIAHLLVDYGSDPFAANHSGKTPLCIAIEQGHISVAQYLLSLGVTLPPDILVTLNLRGIWSTAYMIRFLVDNGADVHACTEAGDSVFHIVLESWSREDVVLDIADLLISYGCDPLQANSSGKTPLHIAIEQDYISVARYLISLGVPLPPDVLVTLSPQGRWKTVDMIRFLIENGADISARNEVGDSVLHIVLEAIHNLQDVEETVQPLVNYGCDLLEPNSLGKTPLRIAVEREHYLAESYLRSLGACDDPDEVRAVDEE